MWDRRNHIVDGSSGRVQRPAVLRPHESTLHMTREPLVKEDPEALLRLSIHRSRQHNLEVLTSPANRFGDWTKGLGSPERHYKPEHRAKPYSARAAPKRRRPERTAGHGQVMLPHVRHRFNSSGLSGGEGFTSKSTQDQIPYLHSELTFVSSDTRVGLRDPIKQMRIQSHARHNTASSQTAVPHRRPKAPSHSARVHSLNEYSGAYRNNRSSVKTKTKKKKKRSDSSFFGNRDTAPLLSQKHTREPSHLLGFKPILSYDHVVTSRVLDDSLMFKSLHMYAEMKLSELDASTLVEPSIPPKSVGHMTPSDRASLVFLLIELLSQTLPVKKAIDGALLRRFSELVLCTDTRHLAAHSLETEGKTQTYAMLAQKLHMATKLQSVTEVQVEEKIQATKTELLQIQEQLKFSREMAVKKDTQLSVYRAADQRMTASLESLDNEMKSVSEELERLNLERAKHNHQLVNRATSSGGLAFGGSLALEVRHELRLRDYRAQLAQTKAQLFDTRYANESHRAQLKALKHDQDLLLTRIEVLEQAVNMMHTQVSYKDDHLIIDQPLSPMSELNSQSLLASPLMQSPRQGLMSPSARSAFQMRVSSPMAVLPTKKVEPSHQPAIFQFNVPPSSEAPSPSRLAPPGSAGSTTSGPMSSARSKRSGSSILRDAADLSSKVTEAMLASTREEFVPSAVYRSTQPVKKNNKSLRMPPPKDGMDVIWGHMLTDRTVPEFLRWDGWVLDTHMTKKEAELKIKELWSLKSLADQRALQWGGTTCSLPAFFSSYLDVHFPVTEASAPSSTTSAESSTMSRAALIEQFPCYARAEFSLNFFQTLSLNFIDGDFLLFVQVLCGHVHESHHFDQMMMLSAFKAALSSWELREFDTETRAFIRTGYCTLSTFISGLKELFPIKPKASMAELVFITERDLTVIPSSLASSSSQQQEKSETEAKKTTEEMHVDLNALLAEDDEGNQSEFVECLRDQYLEEVHAYITDLREMLYIKADETAKLQGISEVVVNGRVTVAQLDECLRAVDPRKPLHEIEQLMVRGVREHTVEGKGQVREDDYEHLMPDALVGVEVFLSNIMKTGLHARTGLWVKWSEKK